jgi:hypothetical protein
MLYLRSINRFILISLALLGLTVSTANAAIVTYGNLTSDDATDFITDTMTGRQYKRFDTINLTYADTLVEVASGGDYEGWSIADSGISDDFIEGLFAGATACSGAVSLGTVCGILSGWSDGDLGQNYDPDFDFYAYISSFDTPGQAELAIGLTEFRGPSVSLLPAVRDFDDWGTISDYDNFYSEGFSATPVGLLLYKDVSAVPVPAAVWLFGTALIGLVGFSKRRKTA